ncbi:YceI family protein [Saccharopolyspora aridisoli]|uniref:YceI family protein n=1 Tax=Saccharopolyspora aridisoli TaxID=2530385 RepID=A0A4V2Y8R2_9PSEU|nr:YceI family protein [Saccharopolyspora aridisoli]
MRSPPVVVLLRRGRWCPPPWEHQGATTHEQSHRPRKAHRRPHHRPGALPAGIRRPTRDGDRFDLDNHPEIVFTSTGVRTQGENTFHVTGDLTIKGNTKPVEFDLDCTGQARTRSAPSASRRGRAAGQPRGLGPDLERSAGTGVWGGRREDHRRARHLRGQGGLTTPRRGRGTPSQDVTRVFPSCDGWGGCAG